MTDILVLIFSPAVSRILMIAEADFTFIFFYAVLYSTIDASCCVCVCDVLLHKSVHMGSRDTLEQNEVT